MEGAARFLGCGSRVFLHRSNGQRALTKVSFNSFVQIYHKREVEGGLEGNLKQLPVQHLAGKVDKIWQQSLLV